jgi:hypothetical protein
MPKSLSAAFRTRLPLNVIALATVFVASLALAAGSVDVASHRSRLTISQEPKNAQQILSVQKTMAAARTKANPNESREVTVVGQIGGMPNVWPDEHPNFPWYEKQASFFVVDTKIAAMFAEHAKHHGGNSSNCAFCQSLAAKNATAIAVVNLVDENGEIIRMDTRELLGLKDNQMVVVHGKARLLGGSMLVIDADGVYSSRQK